MSTTNIVPIDVRVHWSAYGQGKAYVARLRGLDERYGFEREFLRPYDTRRSRSAATMAKVYMIDEPGIYEVQESGRKRPRRYYIEVFFANDELRKIGSLDDREITAAEARELLGGQQKGGKENDD